MSDNNSTAKIEYDWENEPGEIIDIDTAKLLKLRYSIRKLNNEDLQDLHTNIVERKEVCEEASKEINALVGDLDDITRQEH